MINRVVIGNIGDIILEKEDKQGWMQIITNAASMTKEEIQAYSDKHFRELSENARTGIDYILKLSWACAKKINAEAKLSLENKKEVRVLGKP
jgi:hypothetical protein